MGEGLMRVPVLVPIGPYKVPIRYVRRCDEDAYGEYCVEDRAVLVSKTRNRTADHVWSTVWHELAHAAVTLCAGKLITLAREEAVVGAIEFGLAPLMLMRHDAPGVRWREIAFPFETQ
jgi:hypothetical protein